MRLEEGMYVRTNGGNIGKIESFVSSLQNDFIKTPYEEYILKKDIKKASFDIIDIIEVDDIITLNGDDDVYKILCIPDKEVTNDVFYLVYTGREFEDIVISQKDMKKNIRSIVTKEQFEQVKYEVRKGQ